MISWIYCAYPPPDACTLSTHGHGQTVSTTEPCMHRNWEHVHTHLMVGIPTK